MVVFGRPLAFGHRTVLNAGIALLALAATTTLALYLINPCILRACQPAGLPSGPVSYKQVSSHPEATLSYPGSQILFPMGAGEQRSPSEGVVNAAFAGEVLRVNAPSPAIYDWYKNWMTSHGWHSSPTLRATTQISVEGYARGSRERFTVAIDNPDALARTIGRPIPAGQGTVYEIAYMILPASS